MHVPEPPVDPPVPTRDARIKPAGIKDVAARAGVSLKTVTNVVHARPHVSEQTRSRVQAAIEELDYRPSLAGRQLQSGRSHTITLAVPRIDEPYLGALAHAMIAAASPRGYTVLIDETGGSAEHEEQAAAGYPGHGIDGVVFSPLALNPQQFAATSRNTPMILLGEQLPNSTADYVAIDNERSAAEVVGHLLDRGRRRIAFVGGQSGRPTSVGELRLQGYRRRLGSAGLEPGGVLETGRYTREEGQRLAAELVSGPVRVDALVCASDLLAIGAMTGLRHHGVWVPDDVAVVGWDGIVDGQYCSPGLTTVAPDLARLAEQTLDALISRIDGSRAAGVSYLVPHQLVVRGSSG